ncbi:hypothetical protein ACGFYT_16090 [Streptomyces sp. NPDC048208]|uniref:hypothetical protein n=1 Tax=Streptomyces sp. NPDC048208 TaxID=3365515 RepID=UPI00371268FE
MTSATAAFGFRSSPWSDSEVSMFCHLSFRFTRTGPAKDSVRKDPDGSAQVVEDSVRSDSTSILRPCDRAISTAEAVLAASAAPAGFLAPLTEAVAGRMSPTATA